MKKGILRIGDCPAEMRDVALLKSVSHLNNRSLGNRWVSKRPEEGEYVPPCQRTETQSLFDAYEEEE